MKPHRLCPLKGQAGKCRCECVVELFLVFNLGGNHFDEFVDIVTFDQTFFAKELADAYSQLFALRGSEERHGCRTNGRTEQE